MRRFFLPAAHISRSQAILSGAEFHHLHHVLRLNVGEQILLKDDQGREHQGVIVQLSSTEATISLMEATAAPSSSFSLILAQGMLKGPKMDFVIEKATELGVRRILPFFSAFTVATVPTERQAGRLARWARIARNAAKQSGSDAPSIDPLRSFADLLATIPADTATVLFHEKETVFTLKRFAHEQPRLSSLCLIVGPEGGFSSEEIAHARAARVPIVGLGRRILRAETAGIVAAALGQFLWET